MESEELYGLTLNQHKALERLDRAGRVTLRGNTEQATRDKSRYRGIARVVMLDPADITYAPKTKRTCGLFTYQPGGQQITVSFSGEALEGDIVLTINGAEIHVDCQADTSELRSALAASGFSLADVRATAFPGLWEFDFNVGRYSNAASTLTAEPYEPPEDDTETPVFSGELSIIQEAFCSASDDGENYVTVETVDWIPFDPGAIKPGAIGAALWDFAAGWLVLAWQCREWSFVASDPYGGV